ncbi:hypothetical protein [uncultured Microbacterium sp.]|uniref:hypothetical protein n=1 Tax=uncultured Microbacterium sp. TaxID=191216 RepID=UPI003749710C
MSSSTASVLAEPLDAYLRRRARSTLPLTPGEAVTAAVGLLRGCRASTAAADGKTWWLTATGCPVAVDDPDGPDAVAATAETLAHLADIADDPPTREIVGRARESVLTRPPRDWEAVERRLFAHATPVPLVLGPLFPAADPVSDSPTRDQNGPAIRMLDLVDADLADATRQALEGVRGHWRRSRPLRVFTLGAGIATIAVLAFCLIPEDRGAQPPSTGQAVVDPVPTSTTPWLSDPPPVDERRPLSDDVEQIARTLFTELQGCHGDAACLSAYEENSAFPREPLAAGAATAEITVVDDFGGVTVVRVDENEATQYVTLVRQNERWLVRAVRTVADQPS